MYVFRQVIILGRSSKVKYTDAEGLTMLKSLQQIVLLMVFKVIQYGKKGMK